MSELAKIAEVVDFIDECLAEADWDRLAGLSVPPLPDVTSEDPTHIVDALIAVQDMGKRIQARMDAITGELEKVPAVRKAARAYVSS